MDIAEGTGTEIDYAAKIRELGNDGIEAWFPAGHYQPNIRLLKVIRPQALPLPRRPPRQPEQLAKPKFPPSAYPAK
jgi:hypothetical protein